ncbi:amidase family protein [Paeniglutamicibacter cryotolerans]|uniref:Mandelamide amidase n=1 Tax=Paeniglutamicibacter cryotolerans TaxID=670079 RepID=A0A839QME8_9MICC|nr:amidase family protein [Paeniglutamicibacter cryotolerans]MBB2996940.1 mandelamide amidase [Paeniglutamicibacter cryotolerans]
MSQETAAGIWTYLADGRIPEANPGATLAGGFDFAVKANIEVAGMPATAASPVFAGYLPEADSAVVTALKLHGGRVAGLTNMHELAFGITSNNATYGPVRNPFDPQRSAGGSSGGSGAAVAAGLVPVSLGTDTGGSISIPAASCGVVGFRPSTGRWPSAGTIGLSWSRDTVGVHARSVEHAATIDAWITNAPAGAPVSERLLLAVPTAFIQDLDPRIATRFAEVVAALADTATIIEVDLDAVIEQTEASQWDLVGWEAPRLLSSHLAAAENISPEDAWELVIERAASPDVCGILEGYDAVPVSPAAYAEACATMANARADYARLVAAAGFDALLFPTLPTVPQRIGNDLSTEHNGEEVPLFPLMTRNLGPGTVLGAPMLTLPAGLTGDGLPVGITLQGPAHRDRGLLAVAAVIEAALAR